MIPTAKELYRWREEAEEERKDNDLQVRILRLLDYVDTLDKSRLSQAEHIAGLTFRRF